MGGGEEALIEYPEALKIRYKPRRVLGQGGFGCVFEATDTQLERPVAVKCLLAPDDPNARVRFRREAEALTKLRHPHVVEAYECGEASGVQYLVMEYLEGQPPAPGELSEEELSELARQVGSALSAIHSAGMVHRDLKTLNMLRVFGRGVVLVDFGLAHQAERTQITEDGSLVGTLAYLAPECLRGAGPNPAADWYALGVALFYLRENRLPFSREELMAYAHGFREGPLSSPVGEDGRPTSVLLAQLLQTEPDARPSSLGDLDLLLKASLGSRRGTPQARSEAKPEGAPEVAVEKLPEPRKRRTRWLVMLCLWLFIGGGVALVWGLPEASREGSVAPSSAPDPEFSPPSESVERAVAKFLEGHLGPEESIPLALGGRSYEDHLQVVHATFLNPLSPLRLRRLLNAMADWSARAQPYGSAAEPQADALLRDTLLPAFTHYFNDLGMVVELLSTNGYFASVGIEASIVDAEDIETLKSRSEEMKRQVRSHLERLGIFVALDRPDSLALRALLVGECGAGDQPELLRVILRHLAAGTDPSDRLRLVYYASHSISKPIEGLSVGCELRQAIGDQMEGELLDDRTLGDPLRVALAGRALMQFYPVLSECTGVPEFERYPLHEAAVSVLEREAVQAPSLATLHLTWFRGAESVLLGGIMHSDPARWSGVGKRIGVVWQGLRARD